MHHLAPVQPAPALGARSARRRWNRPPAQLVVLKDQTVVRVRTAVEADLDAVQDLHRRCSPTTRYARYHAGKSRLTHADWAHLNNPRRAVCWLVTERGRPEHVIAMLNLVRPSSDATAADLAVMVEDTWQRRGLGRQLLRLALQHAQRHHLRHVTAVIPSHARRVHAELRSHGFHTTGTSGTTTALALDLPRTTRPDGAPQ